MMRPRVSGATAEAMHLNCSADDDAAVATRLEADHRASLLSLGETAGHISYPLEMPVKVPLPPVPNGSAFDAACPRLPGAEARPVCSCRVGECPQGALVADAPRRVTGADIGLVRSSVLPPACLHRCPRPRLRLPGQRRRAAPHPQRGRRRAHRTVLARIWHGFYTRFWRGFNAGELSILLEYQILCRFFRV